MNNSLETSNLHDPYIYILLPYYMIQHLSAIWYGTLVLMLVVQQISTNVHSLKSIDLHMIKNASTAWVELSLASTVSDWMVSKCLYNVL